MKPRRLCIPLFFLIFLVAVSPVSPLVAQDEEGSTDPLEEFKEWTENAISGLWSSITSLQKTLLQLFTLEGFLEWINQVWGGITAFFNWLWNQFYAIFIAPVVSAWKSAWIDIKAIFTEPLNSFRYWMTVQVPTFFTNTFGIAAPLVLTFTAVGIVFALYIGIKMAIQLAQEIGSMLFGSNMTGFFVVISVILALLTLAKWLGQLSQAGLTLTKWFLISVAGLVMVWGIYNVIGQRLGLWSPISLDAYLKPISDAIERFIEWFTKWILDVFARFLKR